MSRPNRGREFSYHDNALVASLSNLNQKEIEVSQGRYLEPSQNFICLGPYCGLGATVVLNSRTNSGYVCGPAHGDESLFWVQTPLAELE